MNLDYIIRKLQDIMKEEGNLEVVNPDNLQAVFGVELQTKDPGANCDYIKKVVIR